VANHARKKVVANADLWRSLDMEASRFRDGGVGVVFEVYTAGGRLRCGWVGEGRREDDLEWLAGLMRRRLGGDGQ